MFPFERLTYFIGLAVALIAWGGNQLVEHLLSTPTILFRLETVAAHGEQSAKVVAQIENLSRTHSQENLLVTVLAPNFETRILGPKVRLVGVEPARSGLTAPVFQSHADTPPDQADDPVPELASAVDLTIDRMEPGTNFTITAPYKGVDRPNIYLRTSDPPLRVIYPSIESFIIRNQFEWTLALVVLPFLFVVVGFFLATRGAKPQPTPRTRPKWMPFFRRKAVPVPVGPSDES